MKKNNIVFIVLAVLFCLNFLAWIAVFDLSKPQYLEVSFFDVGQGDAILVETPRGHQILIDGGPDFSVLEKLGQEMPFYDRSIDLIILTHPEHDHIAGLIEVLKRYRVDNILWTGVLRDTAEYREWLKLIEKEGAEVKIAQLGQKITCSRRLLGQQVFNILNPLENLEGKKVQNSNNTSIIAKLIFNENSFLFTGDAYKSVERKLLEKEINLDSDVLKVGHHGSKTSTSEEFLEQVLPEIAVISAGLENRYGHPHQETLATLNKYDIKVLRTDKEGDIKIISDGYNLKVINNYQKP